MMKLLLPFLLCIAFAKAPAQTATDFTVTDCNGLSYNLFENLDAGKIVVITWTMPCGACVSGSLTAYNVVQSYEAAYPGKVKMLLVDDFGNTPCSAIKAWGDTYGLGRAIKFSNAAISMSDYGEAGMPKTIAIAPDHSVIFNENNTVDPENLQAAIDAVLTSTSTANPESSFTSASIFPNPAAQIAMLKLHVNKNSEVEVKIYDLSGQELHIAFKDKCATGENLLPLDISHLNNGLYQVRISDGQNLKSLSLLVSR